MVTQDLKARAETLVRMIRKTAAQTLSAQDADLFLRRFSVELAHWEEPAAISTEGTGDL